MSEWIEVKKEKPTIYRNVLCAFADHWNQVVCFYTGKGEWYETSAHDNNTKISGDGPIMWMPIDKVHHDPTTESQAERERAERATKFAAQFCEKANDECSDYDVYMDQRMEALLATEVAAFAASEVQLAVAQLEHDLEESELRAQTNADALVAIKLRADTAVAEERGACAKAMCRFCAFGNVPKHEGAYWHHIMPEGIGSCYAAAIHERSKGRE